MPPAGLVFEKAVVIEKRGAHPPIMTRRTRGGKRTNRFSLDR